MTYQGVVEFEDGLVISTTRESFSGLVEALENAVKVDDVHKVMVNDVEVEVVQGKLCYSDIHLLEMKNFQEVFGPKELDENEPPHWYEDQQRENSECQEELKQNMLASIEREMQRAKESKL